MEPESAEKLTLRIGNLKTEASRSPRGLWRQAVRKQQPEAAETSGRPRSLSESTPQRASGQGQAGRLQSGRAECNLDSKDGNGPGAVLSFSATNGTSSHADCGFAPQGLGSITATLHSTRCEDISAPRNRRTAASVLRAPRPCRPGTRYLLGQQGELHRTIWAARLRPAGSFPDKAHCQRRKVNQQAPRQNQATGLGPLRG